MDGQRFIKQWEYGVEAGGIEKGRKKEKAVVIDLIPFTRHNYLCKALKRTQNAVMYNCAQSNTPSPSQRPQERGNHTAGTTTHLSFSRTNIKDTSKGQRIPKYGNSFRSNSLL